jgi:hypothetical protein
MAQMSTRDSTSRPDPVPAPGTTGGAVDATSSASEVAAFLRQARSAATGGEGRLIFALDATMSRQPTWDRACALQSEMFAEAAALGGLTVQLVYYRGIAECKASKWVLDGAQLAGLMGRIDCRGGHTQIARILRHARGEALRARVRALVFVGDAMEEKLDDVCAAAGELALTGCPVLAFQEGRDPLAEQALREVARITGGAWCRFDLSAASELRDLLRAAAAYAAGGRAALEDLGRRQGTAAPLLLGQLR